MSHKELADAALVDLRLLMPHWRPSITELRSLLRLAQAGFDREKIVAIAVIARTWR